MVLEEIFFLFGIIVLLKQKKKRKWYLPFYLAGKRLHSRSISGKAEIITEAYGGYKVKYVCMHGVRYFTYECIARYRES